jgi:hypothetical protein
MKVSVVRGGGVAGMVRVSEIDSADLGGPDARALAELVDKAGVAVAPAAGPAPAHADEMAYEVRVDDGGEPVVARFGESSLSDGVRELMAWVAQRPETRSRLAPPGD